MSERWDVLVVDDEPVVCDGARLVLEAAGYRVAAASSGAEALAHPALASCAVVLCDLMLQEPSGLGLLRALHERRPDLPVVMITGYAIPERAVEALEAGAAGFLAKPFDDSELIQQVRLATETPAAVTESEP